MSNKINKIIDNLYIGNYSGALDKDIIMQYNINTIVNCTKKKDKINMDVDYLQIPIDDPPYTNDIAYVNTNFIEIINFILNAMKNGNVLVHCVMGSQRSAVIVSIVLMMRFGLNYENAIKFVKSKRSICFFGKVNYLESLVYVQNQINLYNYIK